MRATAVPNPCLSPPVAYRAGLRISWLGMFAIALAHGALLALLASLDVVPLPAPLATLMVEVLPATPPAPAVAQPRPTPVDRKPVVRPRATPQPAMLAARSEAPAVAAAPVVKEAPPAVAVPMPAAPVAATPPRFDADYLHNPAPAYPALSRRLGEEGKVILRVFVQADGRPGQIEIKESSASSRLDQAAVDAVGRWQFVAARRAGEALGAWVLVPIVFNLRG